VKRVFSTCAIIVATTILTLSSLPTHAGETYYRWTDDRGNPVHSDRPPPKGVDYEVVSTGSSLIRPVESEEGIVPLEAKPRVGNEFEQVDTKETKIEKNPEYCQRARDNLEALSLSVRIRVRDDQGEYRYLNKEEKEAQRQQAQDMMEMHCE
jgi:hypothetical protein